MKVGHFELTTISGGRFRLDGGTMFGVVPKVLWSRKIEPDELNNIPQATNCVLVRNENQTCLIDTGYGPKLTEKERARLSAEDGFPLVKNLEDAGVAVEAIDMVILSHLHFDHAGGATRHDENGHLVPTFPNAEYVVQQQEWEIATANLPELRGAYPQDNFLPLESTGQLRFIDGDVEIVPGIRSVVTGGHTLAHQVLVIESEGEGAVYLGDLCATFRHLRTRWGMSYDVDMLQVRRKKPEILGWIADHNYLALSDHDPDHAAARLTRDEKEDFRVTEAWTAL